MPASRYIAAAPRISGRSVVLSSTRPTDPGVAPQVSHLRCRTSGVAPPVSHPGSMQQTSGANPGSAVPSAMPTAITVHTLSMLPNIRATPTSQCAGDRVTYCCPLSRITPRSRAAFCDTTSPTRKNCLRSAQSVDAHPEPHGADQTQFRIARSLRARAMRTERSDSVAALTKICTGRMTNLHIAADPKRIPRCM
jgi:hypothetical protein